MVPAPSAVKSSSGAGVPASPFGAPQLQSDVMLASVLNVAPEGTRMRFLHLGYLAADAGFFLRGANTSTMSNPKGPNGNPQRRDLVMYAILIEHPTEGLILWETGCGKDYPEVGLHSSQVERSCR